MLNRAVESNLLEKLIENEATRLKTAVADALDGVHAAHRAMKRGLAVAEEMMDGAAHEVKRHPLPVASAAARRSTEKADP